MKFGSGSRIYFPLFLLLYLVVQACNPAKRTSEDLNDDDFSKTGTDKPPIPVIFDTDISGDYDDVGAMALLHAMADFGEIEILAIMSSNAFRTTVPAISVINTYFNRPEIPVGVTKESFPNKECPQKWAQAIIARYPHQLKSNEEAPDAVQLYRKILAQAADQSVTIITVGFFTNLAGLLDSTPDQFSPLNGKELVRQKVSVLVSMAARLEKEKDRGREYNIYVDTRSAQEVFTHWDTPVILSPFEVGVKILTGVPLIHNQEIQNSPVKDAYHIAMTKSNNTAGRMSWDQTAVLVAVRGIQPYFYSQKLNMRIEDDGTNVLIPGERFTYLSLQQSANEIAAIIEKMMAHQPQAEIR